MTFTIVAIIVLLALAGYVLLQRRRDRGQTDRAAEPPPLEDTTPMTGLESALDQATDRSGRPIRDRLDDESSIVDDLRVPDDTGPLLRRALDHVAQPPPTGDAEAGTTNGPETAT